MPAILIDALPGIIKWHEVTDIYCERKNHLMMQTSLQLHAVLSIVLVHVVYVAFICDEIPRN